MSENEPAVMTAPFQVDRHCGFKGQDNRGTKCMIAPLTPKSRALPEGCAFELEDLPPSWSLSDFRDTINKHDVSDGVERLAPGVSREPVACLLKKPARGARSGSWSIQPPGNSQGDLAEGLPILVYNMKLSSSSKATMLTQRGRSKRSEGGKGDFNFPMVRKCLLPSSPSVSRTRRTAAEYR